jgi:hypothetical protein
MNVEVSTLPSQVGNEVRSLLKTTDRPPPITIVAALCALGAVIGIVGSFAAIAAGAIFLGTLALVLSLVAAASALGLFGMRKWGLHLYAATVVANVAVSLILAGTIPWLHVVIAAIVIAICFRYYAQMK